ncbi:MAG: hypothetical protein ACOYK8_10505 [Alphaproteobacteria bacterium]
MELRANAHKGISFIFPIGNKANIEEFITDTLQFLSEKLQEKQPALTLNSYPISLNCGEGSLWPSIKESIEDITRQSADIIPIIAQGFERMASTEGARATIVHDYIQDIVQNNIIAPSIQAADKKLLIITPIDIEHEQSLAAMEKFSYSGFNAGTFYIGCDENSIVEKVLDYQNELLSQPKTLHAKQSLPNRPKFLM